MKKNNFLFKLLFVVLFISTLISGYYIISYNSSFHINNSIDRILGLEHKKLTDKIQTKLKENPNFNIKDLKEEGFLIDIFDECRKYVYNKNDKIDSIAYYLNNDLEEFNIDFTKKIDCKFNQKDKLCLKIKKVINKKNKYLLEDIALMLYALSSGNMSYKNYIDKIGDIKNVDFPDLIPDYIYSKYYGLIASGKINKIDDCINFLSINEGNIH